ncbi:MAG: hypothetical protein A2W91_16555 [Bacteroidetes bacterium GWF2_38_335]|nr:MAG: hypothetical protein A2W91_16555 [Bacteroidetes bacterium GWF2_38_335]OFY81299.1 MAG: hypothetical protein A2281_07530 [Bacteroidetes bacterium RIFOXYA12_FULL_38_20]HBS85419.1 hypothetical protein [Bacteroidales bacterium]
MKKLLSIAVLLAGVAIIFSSCGKYEDGPKISLKSKKARVAAEWVVEKTYFNDTEQTLDGDEQYYIMALEKDGTGKYIVEAHTDSEGNAVAGGEAEIEWEFDEDNLKIRTRMKFGDAWSDWGDYTEITRLKENELWTKDTEEFGGVTSVYEVHYVKK